MLFGLCVFQTGQEADKGPVWRTCSPPELLQVHGTGVQRDVPPLLHQAASLQSHQVPAAVQIDGSSRQSSGKMPAALRHSKI